MNQHLLLVFNLSLTYLMDLEFSLVMENILLQKYEGDYGEMKQGLF